MSKVHTSTWSGSRFRSPQAACAHDMQNRQPFLLCLTFMAAVGDLIIFPEYFVTYPVLRYATEEEIRTVTPWILEDHPHVVVGKEPPQEDSQSVTTGDEMPVSIPVRTVKNG